MSLIIEALKRARDDAIRRQAASRGLPLAPVPRMRGRSRWLSFALLPLAAALVVCIILLVDLYSRIPEPAAPREEPSQTPSLLEAGEESATASSTEMEIPPTTAPVVESAPGDPVSASLQPSPAPAVRSASPATEPIATQPTTPEPAAQSPTRANPREAREFVGQAELLGGQLVDLEGIAWSESEPFALLNGRVVGVGEFIRAYRVTEITRDQVTLEQGDDRVVLRLK